MIVINDRDVISDIDECKYRIAGKYKCYGHCRDTEGSYECKCPGGNHGKPKEAPCEPNFPRVAQIAVGENSNLTFRH